MPKLKPGTIIPTPEEDAAITAAATSDPDAMPLSDSDSDSEWSAVKPKARVGRPPKIVHKVPTTIRFDPDVLAALKATGKGWQTRVNEAMREWVKSH